MPNLKQLITDVRVEFNEQISKIQKAHDLERVRVNFLGKQGKIAELLAGFRALSVEEKKESGPLLNALKTELTESIKDAKNKLIEQKAHSAQEKQKNFDVTAYQVGKPQGHLHPYTQITEEIENIFISMGYDVLDGPFVETDFYNFGALNIPEDHPARDMYDTFWLNKEHYLLRTHTSTLQVRTMEQQKPPIAAIVPGYTFRHDSVDATHDIMFMQCEGFLIDKNVTLAHLFATVKTFLKALFKVDDLDIRIRPGFFPFVEPGIEIDMRCPFCKAGCSVCKKSTWIEIFPGGLIHPNVLRAGGYDPEEYSGFAFGFGLTRLAMLKYKINDIRLLLGGKMKFLEQF